ncbi:MAG TPA: TIGR03084 family metal-binding protein [Streptosporangiaceae bacterium]
MDASAWAALRADLAAESRDADGMLAGLEAADWERATPAEGWAVRDQVSHLAWVDDAAVTALTDPERFRAETAAMLAATGAGRDPADRVARGLRGRTAAELLAWFRASRARLLDTFGQADPATRAPWYGPSMSAASSATARLMETWAHGQDIADALGVERTATARLRHIAHLGVRTRDFAYANRGLATPDRPVRVVLTAPDGGTWAWGPDDAADQVTGPALDFCLAVTQRRNLADTALTLTGPAATEWMGIAQAFAGPPGPGRPRSSQARGS